MTDAEIQELMAAIGERFPGTESFLLPYSDGGYPSVRWILRVLDVREDRLSAVVDFAWDFISARCPIDEVPLFVSPHGPETSSEVREGMTVIERRQEGSAPGLPRA